MNNVHLLPDDIRFKITSGATISDALSKAGISVTHPCGKKGYMRPMPRICGQ